MNYPAGFHDWPLEERNVWFKAETVRIAQEKINGHAQPPRFVLQPFNAITVGSRAVYLVKGIIPRSGLVLIYGAPKWGKSFLTFDLMMHVALGWEYRNRRVKQGPVVYCAFEGAEGFKARVEAFRQARLAESASENVDFFLVPASMALAKDHVELIRAITEQSVSPAAVVLDTLNRSIGGSESKDEDMAAYVNAAGAIQAEFGCVVIIVHHSGIDASRPRGHTSLTGAADAQIVVKREVGGNIVAMVEFMKDGPEGDQVVSRLKPVDVGTDEDGDLISSCVVEPVEGVAPTASAKAPLSGSATKALQALHEALDEFGHAPTSSQVPPSVPRTVSKGQWRQRAYSLGISDSDKTDAREKAFSRSYNALLKVDRIGVWEDEVWPV